MFLDKIRPLVEKRIKEDQDRCPLNEMKKKALYSQNPFLMRKNLGGTGFSIIAEIKPSSPSVGVISNHVSVEDIARDYEEGGASAISILTEPKYFKGCLDRIPLVRSFCKLPILRKDFIIDEYQVYQSRAAGAHCVLLIAAMLDSEKAEKLASIAEGLGMDVLFEIHELGELNIVENCSPKILGINNRDLKTLKVDLQNSLTLRDRIPKGVIVISESGVKEREDVALLEKHGFHGALIGETLMKAKDRKKKLKELLGGKENSRCL